MVTAAVKHVHTVMWHATVTQSLDGFNESWAPNQQD